MVVFGAASLRGNAFGVGDLTPGQTASFWLLLGNWSQAAAASFLVGPLAVTWSVAIEEQFYLVWPWVVWSIKPSRLAPLCVAVIVSVASARLAAQAAGLNDVALYVSTWTRLDALAVGSLLAVATRQGMSTAAHRSAIWATLAVAGVGAATGDLWLEVVDPTDRYFPTAFSLGPGITLGAIAAGAFLLLAADASSVSKPARVLGSPLLRSFGRYSYGIYLTHGPVRALIRDRLYGPGTDGADLLVPFTTLGEAPLVALALYAAICLPLCWAVGWLSYRLVELPFLRLKTRFPARPVER